LKTRGFVTWQTIQLLLGPEEHVPFLQNAVKELEIVDPETGKRFPSLLPKACFPPQPDKDMVEWYEGVGEKLQREAEEEKSRTEPNEQAPSEDGAQSDASVEEREDAAKYFANPFYRDTEGRPGISRQGSRLVDRLSIALAYLLCETDAGK